jgi:hypothetical protein
MCHAGKNIPRVWRRKDRTCAASGRHFRVHGAAPSEYVTVVLRIQVLDQLVEDLAENPIVFGVEQHSLHAGRYTRSANSRKSNLQLFQDGRHERMPNDVIVAELNSSNSRYSPQLANDFI